jgi:hypothetical protein
METEHPYRTAWTPPIPLQKPEPTPSQIIKAAEKAIEHFSKSCPSSNMLMFSCRNGKTTLSPHGTRTILRTGMYDVRAIPCCDEYRQALRDLKKLSKFWSWWADRKLKRKKLYFQIIRNDSELMALLLPGFWARMVYLEGSMDYADYIELVRYKQKSWTMGLRGLNGWL